jgi:hypothetical protein
MQRVERIREREARGVVALLGEWVEGEQKIY